MAENENTLTISISCPREESNIDDNVSHTIPLLLGFFVGIVIPVIFLVCFSDLAHEIRYVNSFMVQKYYKPLIVLLYFIVTIIALLGFYFIHCRYIAETKSKNNYHLFVHCWIYTVCVSIALAVLSKLNLTAILAVFVTHVILDYSKPHIGRKIGEKAYALDQILHYIVLLIVGILLI